MPGAPQSTSFADAIERYGDGFGFQAVTVVTGAPHDPVDSAVDDQTLVAIDRLSRALHAINFLARSAMGCCSCACTNGC